MPINLAKLQGALRPPCDDLSQDGPQVSTGSGGPIEPGQRPGGIGRDVAPIEGKRKRPLSTAPAALRQREKRKRDDPRRPVLLTDKPPDVPPEVQNCLIAGGYLSDADLRDKRKLRLALQEWNLDSAKSQLAQQKNT